MIITRAPFRISFAGGGSDLPSFYRKHGGCVISTSINRYIYIDIHPFFDRDRIQLKYSRTENVATAAEVQHRIFRETLQAFNLNGVELTSTADIPAGTGMGSSSAFTVALLQAVHAYQHLYRSKHELAAEACDLEINKVGSPIGKQDQYASAFGGLNFIRFNPDDSVSVEPVIIDRELREALDGNLHLYFTGLTRDANALLEEQQRNLSSDRQRTDNMIGMMKIAEQMKITLENRDLSQFGALLHEAWELKKSLSNSISGSHIDDLYNAGRRAGATGGKLLGAGGGGFLLYYVEPWNRDKFVETMAGNTAVRKVGFNMEQGGVQVIHYEH